MATVLDISLLQYFGPIFPFLFIFAMFFALLQKTKIIGESMGINAVISAAVAVMAVLSKSVVMMFYFMIPWFVIVIVFVLLLVLVFMTLGVKDVTIASAITGKDKTILWSIIGVSLLIFVSGLGSIMGQSLLSTGQGDVQATQVNVVEINGTPTTSGDNFQSNIVSTLFHPKVLGLIMIFVIAVFAVMFLSG